MTTPALVELRHVSHFAGRKALVQDVDWQIETNTHCAILGPNGAGKTTLLKIICGYLWPNGGGQVLRDGQAWVDLSQWRRGIGWLTSQLTSQIPSQERVLDTVLSGRTAQIGLKRFPGWEPDATDEASARRALAELGCLELADRTFGTLSQGEQQKTLIARASLGRHRLLILDEPCAGLDPGARESLLEAIDTLGKRPDASTMLLVTHHVEEIMPAFTHALVLKEAHMLARGASSEILTVSMLSDLYGRTLQGLTVAHGRYWPVW
jgi:iron complex transport system ATP-binding protein